MLLWQNAFERYLKQELGGDLEVVWTRNRRLMISYRKKKGRPHLRLHEAFQMADAPLQKELLSYLTGTRRQVPPSVKEFIRQIPDESKEERQVRIKTAGSHYDLTEIAERLNRLYFDGRLKGKITWGRRIFRRQRSIQFGSYSPEQDLIRIHPILDTELVPLYYLESIVHHELLHEHIHKFEPEFIRPVHSARFRELERSFEHHAPATEWQEKHLHKLLGRRRAWNG